MQEVLLNLNIKASNALSNPHNFATVASGSVTVKVAGDDCFVYSYNSVTLQAGQLGAAFHWFAGTPIGLW